MNHIDFSTQNIHPLRAMNLCELRCRGLHFWCYIALKTVPHLWCYITQRPVLHFESEQRAADHMPSSIVLQSSYQQNLQGAQKLNLAETHKKGKSE